MQFKESVKVTALKWIFWLTILPIVGISIFSLNQFEKVINYELKSNVEKSIKDVFRLIDEKQKVLTENSSEYKNNLRLIQSLYYSNVSSTLNLAKQDFKNKDLHSISFFNKNGVLLVSLSRGEQEVSEYTADINHPIYLSQEQTQGFEMQNNRLLIYLTTSILDSNKKIVGYVEQTTLVEDKDLHKMTEDSRVILGVMSTEGSFIFGTHEDLYLIEEDILSKLNSKGIIPDFSFRGDSYLIQISNKNESDKPFKIFAARNKKESNLVLKEIKITFLAVMSFVILLTFFLVFFGKKELNKQILDLQIANNTIKQTQSQLVLSAKMASLGQLVAGVAHELNNPISFIYSNMSELKKYSEKIISFLNKAVHNPNQIESYKQELEIDYIKEDLPKLIKSCEDGSVRIKNIVQNLQSFSRTDSNDFKSVNIHDCIDTTLNILKSEYKDNIEIIKKYSDLPLIYCNPGQINQVVMNILSNSFQAIQAKGVVKIETVQLGQKIEIKISDNGKGIDKEHLDKIFDPFFTTKPVGDGTGLGLSIAFGVIQSHKGQIQVKSELGEGTEFIIHLPI